MRLRALRLAKEAAADRDAALRNAPCRARSDIKIKDVLTRCKVGCAQHEGHEVHRDVRRRRSRILPPPHPWRLTPPPSLIS